MFSRDDRFDFVSFLLVFVSFLGFLIKKVDFLFGFCYIVLNAEATGKSKGQKMDMTFCFLIAIFLGMAIVLCIFACILCIIPIGKFKEIERSIDFIVTQIFDIACMQSQTKRQLDLLAETNKPKTKRKAKKCSQKKQ